ncbi:SRPBCC family protein [Mumia zhuanghuii]|uniref:Carbon monoxide dehydrogenase n=1 Tax=Mumia zhuanghuii TaxID=2585211 RepID=A0A5C4MP43_9ACTN|nr:SRPBCC family protein [Mumia zhuanghuii]TNC42777.1 carbon monoxide dehydrogenase [Mumia zhuanghuii]TNC46396.1 carbon monoxide dehydrogenase [Mumia zhuanghuii]
MELTHTFTVPAPLATTWAAFNDLESIAPCMPGATVEVVDEFDFTGTIKIKLGPISLVYGGKGTYVERDEAERRVVIDAKGKDKRGQGTAGAKVTARLFPDGDGTRVEVQTDLAITGKPAQFGRGVIQDVSDKLLSQFVGCISDQLSAPPPAAEAPLAEATEAEATEAGATGAATTDSPDSSGEASEPGRHAADAPGAVPAPGPLGATHGDPLVSDAAELDLGATVLPVLLKRYGVRVAAGAAVAFVVWRVVRRRKG